MPRYSLGELIQRANAGNIGRKGLRRLEQANLAHAASGVDIGLTRDPGDDLAARRANLYAQAVEQAHNLQPGQELSAGIQRRLQLGAGGPMSRDTFAPHSAEEVNRIGANPEAYNAILAALRKRSQGIGSTSGVYKRWA